jgi:hypothetical protein
LCVGESGKSGSPASACVALPLAASEFVEETPAELSGLCVGLFEIGTLELARAEEFPSCLAAGSIEEATASE